MGLIYNQYTQISKFLQATVSFNEPTHNKKWSYYEF